MAGKYCHFERGQDFNDPRGTPFRYPPGDGDDQVKQRQAAGLPDALTRPLLDAAHKYGLKVAMHIEPYNGRDVRNLRANIDYILTKLEKMWVR